MRVGQDETAVVPRDEAQLADPVRIGGVDGQRGQHHLDDRSSSPLRDMRVRGSWSLDMPPQNHHATATGQTGNACSILPPACSRLLDFPLDFARPTIQAPSECQ